jgi:hypothetical protein
LASSFHSRFKEGGELGRSNGGIEQGDGELGDYDGGCGGKHCDEGWRELAGVFGGEDEGVRVEFGGAGGEGLRVAEGVGVVIAEADSGGRSAAGGAEGRVEADRAGEGAEGQWMRGDGCGGAIERGEVEGALGEPEMRGGVERVDFWGQAGVFVTENDDVSAAEGGEGFAEVAGGEEMVGEVGAQDEDDLNLAGELAVLEAIVEEVDSRLGGGLLFGEEACVIAAGGDVDVSSGAGEKEGFVAELDGGASGIDVGGHGVAATVATGEDVGVPAEGGEEGAQREDEGRLAGTAGGEVADADDGPGEALLREQTTVIQGVARGDGGGVERHQRQKEAAGVHASP